MSDQSVDPSPNLGRRFPATFWFANGAELFERAAFYAMFISLDLYLSRSAGFTDVEAHWIAGPFAFLIYFFPPFVGALADRIGFRRALILAFSLLTLGYAMMGRFPDKVACVIALGMIAFGGAIIKPVISGTAAKCSDADNRVRAFSIFYMVVNIGSFGGKMVAGDLRERWGLDYIMYYAAVMSFCALVLIVFYYKDIDAAGTRRSLKEIVQGFVKVVTHVRFMSLILVVAGFWIIQGQLYSSMPKYIIRLLGEDAKPEWLANINPLTVVILVRPISHLIRKWKPENCISIGLAIIPLSALSVATGSLIQTAMGNEVSFFGLVDLHPITLMVIIGISIQGLAECFLSPKFMEYASKQAPEGEVGLYMGYQHLTTAISWLFGFVASGYLLDAYCPDPQTLGPAAFDQYQQAVRGQAEMPAEYANAHYIWLVFCGIGVAAFLAALTFNQITNYVDRRRRRAEQAEKE